jgi:hypothetical protein
LQLGYLSQLLCPFNLAKSGLRAGDWPHSLEPKGGGVKKKKKKKKKW